MLLSHPSKQEVFNLRDRIQSKAQEALAGDRGYMKLENSPLSASTNTIGVEFDTEMAVTSVAEEFQGKVQEGDMVIAIDGSGPEPYASARKRVEGKSDSEVNLTFTRDLSVTLLRRDSSVDLKFEQPNNDTLLVQEVLVPDSIAAKGDVVSKIDGTSTKGMAAPHMHELIVGNATQNGTNVALTLRRTFSVSMPRKPSVQVEYQKVPSETSCADQPAERLVARLPKDSTLAYVNAKLFDECEIRLQAAGFASFAQKCTRLLSCAMELKFDTPGHTAESLTDGNLTVTYDEEKLFFYINRRDMEVCGPGTGAQIADIPLGSAAEGAKEVELQHLRNYNNNRLTKMQEEQSWLQVVKNGQWRFYVPLIGADGTDCISAEGWAAFLKKEIDLDDGAKAGSVMDTVRGWFSRP
mmetsp:Transcript_69952/g.105751  ORF Transcript_69952/g.105751 Transcript_69952/m.105751 type:complete len:409 (+) Transcript_69952:2-1228(+)